MAKNTKRAMGRGLSALLNDEQKNIRSVKDSGAKNLVGSIIEIPLKDIIASKQNPRQQFDPLQLNELAQSISQLGVIQPITVRKTEGNQFEIISGERRFRASKIAKLESIPAYIRLANDHELFEMALVENIQRTDLDAIEIALSYEKLIEDVKLTQEKLSIRVGKERSTITNYLRLLKLDPLVQNGIRDGKISMGHGRALISIENPDIQKEIFTEIITKELSVRKTEALVKKYKNPSDKKEKTNTNPPNYIVKSIKKFEDYFEVPVSIQANNKGKGKILLSFENAEELENILNHLK